ncbi:MAG: NAD-dependent deacylase [Chloroflexota bacterium]
MLSEEHLAELEKASQIVAQCRHVVAMVGAGMSAESGIPTYRGAGGLWTRIGEPDPRSFQNFAADPKAWWQRMLDREINPEAPERAHFREAIAKAQPNPGHYALVELEGTGILRYIITQNIDNLHRVAGSINVAEIHGNRTRLRCMRCHWRVPREEFEIVDVPPRCPQCGGIIKGDGVMFGEPIPPDVLNICFRETDRCDCMIVLGTSGTVYPAAGFPVRAHERGAYLIEINTEPTSITDIVDVSLRGPTGEILPLLVTRVRELVAQRAP